MALFDPDKARELMRYFKLHGVSHKNGHCLEQVLKWQDLVGGNIDEIVAFEASLDDLDRDLFLFINCNCLDRASVEFWVKRTIAARHIDPFMAEHEKLCSETTALKEQVAALKKKNADLEKDNGELKNTVSLATKAIDKMTGSMKMMVTMANVFKGGVTPESIAQSARA